MVSHSVPNVSGSDGSTCAWAAKAAGCHQRRPGTRRKRATGRSTACVSRQIIPYPVTKYRMMRVPGSSAVSSRLGYGDTSVIDRNRPFSVDPPARHRRPPSAVQLRHGGSVERPAAPNASSGGDRLDCPRRGRRHRPGAAASCRPRNGPVEDAAGSRAPPGRDRTTTRSDWAWSASTGNRTAAAAARLTLTQSHEYILGSLCVTIV